MIYMQPKRDFFTVENKVIEAAPETRGGFNITAACATPSDAQMVRDALALYYALPRGMNPMMARKKLHHGLCSNCLRGHCERCK